MAKPSAQLWGSNASTQQGPHPRARGLLSADAEKAAQGGQPSQSGIGKGGRGTEAPQGRRWGPAPGLGINPAFALLSCNRNCRARNGPRGPARRTRFGGDPRSAGGAARVGGHQRGGKCCPPPARDRLRLDREAPSMHTHTLPPPKRPAGRRGVAALPYLLRARPPAGLGCSAPRHRLKGSPGVSAAVTWGAPDLPAAARPAAPSAPPPPRPARSRVAPGTTFPSGEAAQPMGAGRPI